jgi:hypothetical protein
VLDKGERLRDRGETEGQLDFNIGPPMALAENL